MISAYVLYKFYANILKKLGTFAKMILFHKVKIAQNFIINGTNCNGNFVQITQLKTRKGDAYEQIREKF